MKLIILQLIFFLAITACSINGDSGFIETVYIDYSNESKVKCKVIFQSDKVKIVENHCANEKQGIYIFTSEKEMVFDWYDKSLSQWSLQEGCNDTVSCYYKINFDKSGNIKKISYSFFINLSEGFYNVKIIDGSLNIIDKKIIDHPS